MHGALKYGNGANATLFVNATGSNQSSSDIIFFKLYYAHFITHSVIGTLLCLFSFISNLICLIAICTYPRLRRRGCILVANLVIINILLSTTVYPVNIITPFYRHDVLPESFCYNFTRYYYLTLHWFIWQECLLSINRFIAIVVPRFYATVINTKRLIATIIVGYLIPFFINAYGLSRNLYVQSPPFGTCRYKPEFGKVYPLIHATLGVYLPVCAIGISYLTIFISFYSKKRRATGPHVLPSDTRSVREAKRMRLAKMLFVSFLWNSLAYLPQPVVSALFPQLYTRYPPLYFIIRYAWFLGLAGNTVGKLTNC